MKSTTYTQWERERETKEQGVRERESQLNLTSRGTHDTTTWEWWVKWCWLDVSRCCCWSWRCRYFANKHLTNNNNICTQHYWILGGCLTHGPIVSWRVERVATNFSLKVDWNNNNKNDNNCVCVCQTQEQNVTTETMESIPEVTQSRKREQQRKKIDQQRHATWHNRERERAASVKDKRKATHTVHNMEKAWWWQPRWQTTRKNEQQHTIS